MANMSKSTFFDAGSNPPVRRVITVRDGVRVEERMPTGVAKELWVDKKGNECTIAMSERGAVAAKQRIDARRAELRAMGWVEHHRCPLTQGTMFASDFPRDLAVPCPEGSYGSLKPCAHIRHAIKERVARQHADRAARDAIINAEALRAAAAEQARADQMQRQTEAVIDMAKAIVAGPAKGAAK